MAIASNKKGSFVFNLLLVLALIAILTYASFKFLTTDKSQQTKDIGEMQIRLINTYTSGEKANLYLEQSARYIQGEVLTNFYANGGYYKNSCGKINDYNLWMKGAENCFLTKDKELAELSYFYNQSLNGYNKNYYEINLLNNYKVTMNNNNFVIQGSEIQIKQDSIKYYFKPYTNIKAEDDLKTILDITEKIKINVNNCKNNIECWQKIDNSFKITQKDKALLFDIDTKKEVGYFYKEDLVLKFGLDFSANNPLFTP